MVKITSLIIVITFVSVFGMLGGCGETVEIPPAHIGKISAASGLQDGIIQPGKIRLDAKWGRYQNLILAETSDHPVMEELKIFMPKDQLNLTVDLRGTMAIASDEETVEKVFSRVTASGHNNNDRLSIITLEKVYEVYGQPVVREVARATITKYTIDEVMANRESIGQELLQGIRKELAVTPLTMTRFGMADLQPPTMIIEAQEAKKKREVEILKADAEKAIALKQAEAALEVAIKQQEVDLKEAETQVLVDQKLAEGVSPAFIAQRSLKILELMSHSENKVFFIPMEAMSNPSLLLSGLNQAREEMVKKNMAATTQQPVNTSAK